MRELPAQPAGGGERAQREEVVEVAHPAPKKPKITDHLDRTLNKDEHERAQRMLAFACIHNGWSHNSIQQEPFNDFCKALR